MEQATLRIGVLADLHASGDPDERASWHGAYDFAGLIDRVDDALGWFTAQRVDVVAVIGDLAHHADPATLDAVLRRCLDHWPGPLRVAAGNHDVADGHAPLDEAVARAGAARLARCMPEGERHGGVRLAAVEAAPPRDGRQFGLVRAPAVDAWGDDPVVLLSHFPLLSHAVALAERGFAYPGDVAGRAAAAAAIAQRAAPTVVLSGHVHARVADQHGTLLQLTQAALIEPPFDAAVVTVATGAAAGAVTVARQTRRAGGGGAAAAAPAMPAEPVLAAAANVWRAEAAGWIALPPS